MGKVSEEKNWIFTIYKKHHMNNKKVISGGALFFNMWIRLAYDFL